MIFTEDLMGGKGLIQLNYIGGLHPQLGSEFHFLLSHWHWIVQLPNVMNLLHYRPDSGPQYKFLHWPNLKPTKLKTSVVKRKADGFMF